MTDTTSFTTMRSLLSALAEAMNLINADVEHHHEQTAYLSFMIAREMGMPEDLIYLCVYAALLHDIGSILSEDTHSVAEIEREARVISRIGAEMLRDLPEFSRVAEVISWCQCSWPEIRCAASRTDSANAPLLRCAGVVFLADRISIQIDPRTPVLTQARRLRQQVSELRGRVFEPEAAEAFLRASTAEFVWLDVAYNPRFLSFFTGEIMPVSLERTVTLTQLMSRIIDFRSPFTAMHSAGVAASARMLASLAGMTEEERRMMEIAGNLHDAGKLRVPRAILEKPAALAAEEFDIVREHPYYSRLILMNVAGFGKIANWAGFHHEKLDGSGYPFRFEAPSLDLGARIMAICDIFSAITEDRPYRGGMRRERATGVLRSAAAKGGLDAGLVALLCDNYAEINDIRDMAAHIAGKRYYASRNRGAQERAAGAVPETAP